MLKPPLPLRVKSDYSRGLAVGTPAEHAARGAALGHPAMALTDLGTLAGQVEFHEACRAHGVKAVTGVEFSDAGRDGRVVVLARDERGYRSLCRLVTDWNERPRDSVALLQGEDASEHLLVLTDEPVTARALLEHGFERAGLGLLVRPSTFVPRSRAAALAGAALGLRFVADVAAVMPRRDDAALLALSTAIHARIGKRRFTAVEPRSLEPDLESFDDFPGAVANTYAIAEMCTLDLTAVRAPFDEHVVEYTAALETRVARFPSPSGAHAVRLRRELAVLAGLGLSRYLVAVADIADEARRRGISLTARGSAVSSLVVHALALSPVDPLLHGLYFERFVRASRRTPPDIDLDVASDRRDELIDWTHRRWGRSHVAAVGTYQTFRRRSAYRDALGALGMRAAEVERFAEGFPDDELELPAPVERLPPRFRGEAALIERLVGRPRHLSTHPSALALSSVPLVEATPLVRAPKGGLVTQLDGHGLSHLGVLKVDLLGNRALSELDEVSRTTGLAPLSAPPDDERTFATIANAETLGCAQLETPVMRSVLRRMPMRRQDDLVAAVALVRPGPGAGPSKRLFLRRARGEDATALLDSRLAEVLAPTHGVLLYEENVIAVLERTTGASAEEADELRAALVRGEDVSPTFHERALANGFEEGAAAALWAELSRFAAYSFSKAHAASVAAVAYQSAHAKVHHSTAFACAVLNHHGGLYPLRTIAAALVRDGVNLRGPDVNKSVMATVPEDGAARVGLGALGHVRRATKLALLAERDSRGPFTTFADFCRRVPADGKELDAFVLSGACDGLAPLSPATYPFSHLVVLGKEAQVPNPHADAGRFSLFRALVRAKSELRYLAMHPTAHPMELLRDEAGLAGALTTTEASERVGKRVRVAGLVAATRRHRTSKGGVMQFVTLEDERGLLESVVSAAQYARLADPIKNPGPYLVEGTVAEDSGATTLLVDSVEPFHQRARPYADTSGDPSPRARPR